MSADRVRVTFFGTTSLHVTDGSTSLCIDAFLTRPSLPRVALGRIAPDRAVIADALERGGVGALDAVFTAHSHYDHALDAPEVVAMRGGTLHGSDSTLNLGRGAGLDAARLRRIADGDVVRLGAFSVRVFESRHSPGDAFPGEIDRPLRMPVRARALRTGACFSFAITHPTGTVLVHPSANVVPGMFAGVAADVVYLGVGGLGRQPEHFRDTYWAEVVETTGAHLVVPVHWDDFTRPLTRPLRPFPRIVDRFPATRRFLDAKHASGPARIRWQDAFETLTPLAPEAGAPQ